jgi:hypothetical protein
MATEVNELSIIAEWKANNVSHIEFHFDCGGDSMGSTEFYIYSGGETIKNDTLEMYFDSEIYKSVEFYEASDGHYIGERGTVEITLVEDDGEPYFQFDKSSVSEWNESFTNMGQVELTQEEADFISNNISQIRGGRDNGDDVVYVQDFIMSDSQEKMLDDIIKRINEMAEDLEMEGLPDDAYGDGDWYLYEYQNIDGANMMHIEVTKSFTIEKEGD